MNKLLLAIIVQIMLGVACYGQTLPRSGRYESPGGAFIQIQNDTLILKADMSCGYPHPPEYDTLAYCKLEHAEGNIYRMKSLGFNPRKIFGNMRVEQYRTGINHDGIIVLFDFPQYGTSSWRSDVSIELTDISAENTANVDSRVTAMLVPKFRPFIKFMISDRSTDGGNYFDGRNFSIARIWCPEKINFNPGVDLVKITIPNFSSNIFFRYFIDDEYIYITDTEIRGKLFEYTRVKE